MLSAGHPVVLHHLRPRRDHHFAADAAAQARDRASTRCATSPAARASREDPYTEEQPGKILHELRRGEMARARRDPARALLRQRRRDAALARPAARDLALDRRRRAGAASSCRNAERALEWIDRYGDLDGDGFVEYARTSEKGLVNQGWKDSGDGVPFPDGRLPEPPIALVEVQGYVYDAKVRMAELYRHVGQPERAASFGARRRSCGTGSAPVLAARSSARSRWRSTATSARCATATTNAGHLLWSRVPTPDEARAGWRRASSSPISSPAGACAR